MNWNLNYKLWYTNKIKVLTIYYISIIKFYFIIRTMIFFFWGENASGFKLYFL